MKVLLISVVASLLLIFTVQIKAQDCSGDVTQRITCYENNISKLKDSGKTLSSQISQFDAQIKLTSLKIQKTEEQISLLSGRIDQIEGSLGSLTEAFNGRAVETYKMAKVSDPFLLLVSADNLSEAYNTLSYLKKIQEGDRNLLARLQKAQDTYEEEKVDQEDLQSQLGIQKQNLANQKQQKNNLLTITKNDEKKYQSLLTEARAQLAALSSYAQSVGTSLLPHQELSDGWGKYFNQRDSQWGNLLVNGDTSDCRGGPCTLAAIGCLATSYAMVVSHYGGSLLPSDVAVNSSNFYASTANFNSPGPSANGHGVTGISNPSVDQIKNALNSGSVVIAGLSKDGGPYPQHYSDHWVVFRSVDGDSFRINDPAYSGAMNVSLKDHYSGWTIIQAKIYN